MQSSSQDLAAFRSRVRDWFSVNTPPDWKRSMRADTGAALVELQRAWFARLRDGGFAAPHWPREWGGRECSLEEQVVFYEELARADAPSPILHFISLYHTPGTLLKWGTEAQRRRYLPEILERGVVWCQGFSEPNAGSDLAALKTQAVRKGDRYIVTGQKVWSSLAHVADYCLLLARTDPSAAKHKGISFFLMDMKSPGITVRPIRQANGFSEFNELFLDGVEISAENLVGAENDGWRVAQATLAAERGLSIVELAERLRMGF
ncbi:MAG: acyl-CoA dehydrogenase family protein, partial [Steroidobacteraceae bacterium]